MRWLAHSRDNMMRVSLASWVWLSTTESHRRVGSLVHLLTVFFYAFYCKIYIRGSGRLVITFWVH